MSDWFRCLFVSSTCIIVVHELPKEILAIVPGVEVRAEALQLGQYLFYIFAQCDV